MQNIFQHLQLTWCPRCVKTHSKHTYSAILVPWTLKVNVSIANAAYVKRVNLPWQAYMEPRRGWNEMENAFQSSCTAPAKRRARIPSAHLSSEASAFKRLVRKRLPDTSEPSLRFQSGGITLKKRVENA